ncbi:hypothetical protein BP5796_08542 [Coleophoma crateriformis]|uniref:N-acetyltransferase domain-containing protein n=1 Tax=Coleophoma crateriformis TaxID=565419 RepID=A0A3D8R7W9_9HELO|nr:hypothetical protein BP5796_08542 [Coleophoma crateriformis]
MPCFVSESQLWLHLTIVACAGKVLPMAGAPLTRLGRSECALVSKRTGAAFQSACNPPTHSLGEASSSSSSSSTAGSTNLASTIRDSPNWLARFSNLQEHDILLLITPVVIPISQDPADTTDPFEPLGRAIASRHGKVRQVPYTQRNGITSTHLGFIKRATIIILCLALRRDHPLQLESAHITLAVCEAKPCIIVICAPHASDLDLPFPTVIHTNGYSPRALEATANLLFRERGRANMSNKAPDSDQHPRPKLWSVTEWNAEKDISSVWDLWTLNVSGISGYFSLDARTLASLLHRPGYAKHYTVCDPRGEEVIGFCATYLSYVDQEGEKLLASIAILLVRSPYQNQGVGLSLFSHVVDQLKKTRGVVRIQLGSTFPRILYGPPKGINLNQNWFRRRGWEMDKDRAGQGRAVYDLVREIPDMKEIDMLFPSPTRPSLNFRPCLDADVASVLAMVDQVCTRESKLGWFDQYSSLTNNSNRNDIMLGVETGQIVAAALTYTPGCGSAIASNLPWAGRVGPDVGGVACICTLETSAEVLGPFTVGLLGACSKKLASQGMRKIFLDGISDNINDFKRLDFKEWAQYKDVWKDL